uniref:Uncharacterized protein n=1 Tax=Anguilla anguilla TaxID=7936 RepID=A0A0E9WR28_ANGAN
MGERRLRKTQRSHESTSSALLPVQNPRISVHFLQFIPSRPSSLSSASSTLREISNNWIIITNFSFTKMFIFIFIHVSNKFHQRKWQLSAVGYFFLYVDSFIALMPLWVTICVYQTDLIH